MFSAPEVKYCSTFTEYSVIEKKTFRRLEDVMKVSDRNFFHTQNVIVVEDFPTGWEKSLSSGVNIIE